MRNSEFCLTVGYSSETIKRPFIDAYDFGMSIAGASQAIQQSIALQSRGDKVLQMKPLLVAVRDGSILVDLALRAADIVPALLPVAPDLLKIGKDTVDTIKGLVEILISLKGKKPEKIRHRQDGLVSLQIEGNNNLVIVKPIIIAAHGDRTIRRGISRLIRPLLSNEAQIDSIHLSHGKARFLSIDPVDAPYLAEAIEFQPTGTARLRGTVRKIDRKTRAGYLMVDNQRITFQYPTTLSQDKFDLIVNSLRTRQPIILVGETLIDLQGAPRLMHVIDVLLDPSLLE